MRNWSSKFDYGSLRYGDKYHEIELYQLFKDVMFKAIQRFRKVVRTVVILLHAVSSTKQKAINDKNSNEKVFKVDNVFDAKHYQRPKEVRQYRIA